MSIANRKKTFLAALSLSALLLASCGQVEQGVSAAVVVSDEPSASPTPTPSPSPSVEPGVVLKAGGDGAAAFPSVEIPEPEPTQVPTTPTATKAPEGKKSAAKPKTTTKPKSSATKKPAPKPKATTKAPAPKPTTAAPKPKGPCEVAPYVGQPSNIYLEVEGSKCRAILKQKFGSNSTEIAHLKNYRTSIGKTTGPAAGDVCEYLGVVKSTEGADGIIRSAAHRQNISKPARADFRNASKFLHKTAEGGVNRGVWYWQVEVWQCGPPPSSE